jgi:hypothetical protein
MASKTQPPVDFGTRVITAATTGLVGAVVGASLSSVTEPLVNKILVERITVSEALKFLTIERIITFFQTAVGINIIKFPFFEVTNVLMSQVEGLSPQAHGAATGAVFCTVTLPLTNFRYRRSMNLPIEISALYQAYLPTVLRDIVYGMVRQNMTKELLTRYPDLPKTAAGKFYLGFVSVLVSCLISAPGNELRGYALQNPATAKPPSEFFQPIRFLRSTIVGALIMGTAMGTGAVVTGPVQDYWQMFRGWMRANQMETILGLFLLGQYLEYVRHSAIQQQQQQQQQKKA